VGRGVMYSVVHRNPSSCQEMVSEAKEKETMTGWAPEGSHVPLAFSILNSLVRLLVLSMGDGACRQDPVPSTG